MQIEWTKYKRFFTFGCSFTSYMWPTWADIISKEMPDAEFFNFGMSGGGNPLISYRIAEANNRFKFTEDDLIMVMFTTYTREDRWTSKNGWIAGGNIFNNQYYPDSWVKEFADDRGYLIRDAAVIDMTVKYLESLPSTSHCMLSVPFIMESERISVYSKPPEDICEIYKDTLSKFKPSMYELELFGNWKEAEKDYHFRDGHPAPIRYYSYMEKLGLNLTNRSRDYTASVTQTIQSITDRDRTPKYFPEQDENIAKAYRLLF